MRKRYIIWAPALTRSAGTKALYTLYDKLRQKGFTALLFCPEEHRDGYEYIDVLDDSTLQNDVVVYPEIVWGNPLRFRNVARFVLYFTGRLAGERGYHHGEKVFTWWSGYCNAPELRWSNLDVSLFFDEHLPKLQNCYFINKNKPWKYMQEFRDAVEINMEYPATRQELARLLKTTEILYTFDRYSVMNDEAVACGARVMVIENDSIVPYVPGTMVTEAETEAMLAHFIAVTQAMQYTGELQDDTKFHEKFGGLNYKTAMRCAACGAWEQALLFAYRAFCGRPLPRPETGGAEHEPAVPTAAARPGGAAEKWRADLEKYNSLVQRGQYDQADTVLHRGMASAIADDKREAFALLAALRSVLQDGMGRTQASLRYAELALLADPLNAMAAQMCVHQLIEAGKVNLALVTACRMCCLFLRPLVFEKAFIGVALLGLIVLRTGQPPAQLADKMPLLMQSAADSMKRFLAAPTSSQEWEKGLAAAERV